MANFQPRDLITRRFRFDAAHRLHQHEGKCKYIHGHGYVAEVSLWIPQLNDLGMVFDFGIVKELIGGWIDHFWDHNILLHPDDVLAKMSGAENGVIWQHQLQIHSSDIFMGKNPFIMASPTENPTAENMARTLFNVSTNLIHDYCEREGMKAPSIHNIRIYETPNCSADYSAAD